MISSQNLPKYTIAKSAFILSILKKCNFIAPRILKPTTEIDWSCINAHENELDQAATYIMCYKGFVIIGYAKVDVRKQISLHIPSQDCPIFQEIIAQWVDRPMLLSTGAV